MQATLIAESPSFRNVLEKAQRAARSTANILITGESGTGKEVIARFIHQQSSRLKGDFIPLNCSAIPEQLLESELFGYAKGAFTGALGAKPGLFEEAHGGTLFLDEIGDMDLSLQAKILRVLQERKIKRVGENQYRDLDIRFLAATHNDLAESVQKKEFREDLYFRLNVVPLHIPPLRERAEDILPLTDYFIGKFSARHKVPSKVLSTQAKNFIQNHYWPGNVRELENVIERAVVLGRSSEIELGDVYDTSTEGSSVIVFSAFEQLFQKDQRLLSLEEMNKFYIEYALTKNQGAKEKTAKDLGIDRKTLYRKISAKDRSAKIEIQKEI